MSADINSTAAGQAPQGLSINSNRRLFNFGERVAELAPAQSPFFVYLSKVAKKPTDDPVFKFLEERHQWQRRNFNLGEAVASAALFSLKLFTIYHGLCLLGCYIALNTAMRNIIYKLL